MMKSAFDPKNRVISDEAPLQLYFSGLVFLHQEHPKSIESSEQSFLLGYASYRELREDGAQELQIFEGHSGSVNSLAFLPRVARWQLLASSGSLDKILCLWGTPQACSRTFSRVIQVQ